MQAIIYDVIGYEVKPYLLLKMNSPTITMVHLMNLKNHKRQHLQLKIMMVVKNNLIFITHSIHLLLVQGTASHMLQV